jgi:hypothetical protein
MSVIDRNRDFAALSRTDLGQQRGERDRGRQRSRKRLPPGNQGARRFHVPSSIGCPKESKPPGPNAPKVVCQTTAPGFRGKQPRLSARRFLRYTLNYLCACFGPCSLSLSVCKRLPNHALIRARTRSFPLRASAALHFMPPSGELAWRARVPPA